MSGWIFLAIGLAATFLDFVAGLWLLRRDSAAQGMALDAPDTARIGRLIMFVSPLFLLVFALLAFGLIPLDGIEPISLGAGDGQ